MPAMPQTGAPIGPDADIWLSWLALFAGTALITGALYLRRRPTHMG